MGIKGTLEAFQNDVLVISEKDDLRTVHLVADNCTLTLDGEAGLNLHELRQGDQVEIEGNPVTKVTATRFSKVKATRPAEPAAVPTENPEEPNHDFH